MNSEPLEGDVVRKPRRWLGITFVQLMGLCAITILAAIVGGAAVMVALEANTGKRKALTPGEYEALGYEPELGVKPWSLENPGCMGMIYLLGLFVLRSHAFPPIVAALCPQHTAAKKEKVANYMLEILLCTAGLIIISVGGVWGLLFEPPEGSDPSPEAARSIAVATFASFQLVVCTYVLEMSFDHAMRFELRVHHYLTIYLGVHGMLAIGTIGGNLYMARLCLAFSLFIFTEGPVFVMLFVYQLKFYQWVIYELLAYYYALSRLFVIATIYWAWWDVRESVFEIYDHNSFIAYSIFLVVPIGVFVLLLTQVTAAANLFGISRRVRGLRRQRQVHARLSKLFTDLGAGEKHGLSLEEWISKVGNVVDGAALPQAGLTMIFQRMDAGSRGTIEAPDFVAFFAPLATNTAGDTEMLRVMLLLAFLEASPEGPGGGEEEAAALAELRGALAPVPSKPAGGRARRPPTVDEYIEKKLADARRQRRGGGAGAGAAAAAERNLLRTASAASSAP